MMWEFSLQNMCLCKVHVCNCTQILTSNAHFAVTLSTFITFAGARMGGSVTTKKGTKQRQNYLSLLRCVCVLGGGGGTSVGDSKMCSNFAAAKTICGDTISSLIFCTYIIKFVHLQNSIFLDSRCCGCSRTVVCAK